MENSRLNLVAWLATAGCAAALLLQPANGADAYGEAKWKLDTDYVISKQPQRVIKSSPKIEVAVIESYVCRVCMDFERQLTAWSATRPEFVSVVRSSPAHDQVSLAYGEMFYALDWLKRADLHQKVYERLQVERKPLVVASGTTIDREATQRLQTSFVAALGVDSDAFRKELANSDIRAQLSFDAQWIAHLGVVRTLPTVVVDGKYVTDIKYAGDHLAEVMEQLVAQADLDYAQKRAMRSVGGQKDGPVSSIRHSVMAGFYEARRASGTWYIDRNGLFAVPGFVTALADNRNLTSSGAAGVSLNQAGPVMREKPAWISVAALARASHFPSTTISRKENLGLFEVRVANGILYISRDGRYCVTPTPTAKP